MYCHPVVVLVFHKTFYPLANWSTLHDYHIKLSYTTSALRVIFSFYSFKEAFDTLQVGSQPGTAALR
jgi:hypothetical protein